MKQIRTFIAISLPDDIHNRLTTVIDTLKNGIDRQVVRWVAPGNIHLTLKFLGEIPENDIQPLKEKLETEAIKHRTFFARCSKARSLPDVTQTPGDLGWSIRAGWINVPPEPGGGCDTESGV